MKHVLFKSCSAVNYLIMTINLLERLVRRCAYLFIPKFRESVHNDAKHYVEANSGDDDEEGCIKEEAGPCIISISHTNSLEV